MNYSFLIQPEVFTVLTFFTICVENAHGGYTAMDSKEAFCVKFMYWITPLLWKKMTRRK